MKKLSEIDSVAPTAIYTAVKPNWCKCHPETCCCNDWGVFIGDKKHSGHYHKDVAELVARALNEGL